jgi:hypothetical protein
MSLKHIQNRRDPTIFGADLNVLLGDVTINGDLDVQGVINGNSDQGQNEDNVWTGTNEWSVFRPQTTPTTGVGFSGVNLSLEQSKMIVDGIINQGATWTGANTFSNNITIPLIPTPVNATDAVPCAYVKSQASVQNTSYIATNNTWTGVNTFDFLPTCIDPVANAEIATKGYTDTAITTLVQGGTTTERRQTNLVPTVFTDVAFCATVIGGGGGSTFGISNSAGGYAGGSGAMSALLVLTKAIGGASKGSFSISVGVGGTAGIGTTPPASYSGSGAATTLSLTPVAGQGLNPATVQVLTAGGGGGNTNSNGQKGNPSLGGVYTNTTWIQSPWASSNGDIGTYNSPAARQWSGIEQFGWGANALTTGDGSNGFRGGFGITNYLG